MTLKKAIHTTAIAVDAGLDRLRQRNDGPLPDDARIVAFRDFGTSETLNLSGRVLRGVSLNAPHAGTSPWLNLLDNLTSLASREVPNATVQARCGEIALETVSDDEGYFRLEIPLAETPISQTLWREVQLTLKGGRPGSETAGYVLVPAANCAFGVISDIDDTIVRTDAAQLLKMARSVFLNSAKTRVPFEGVSAFYRALQAGPADSALNPLFYVSSGPWNFYEFLIEYLKNQEIPFGPLMLQDYGITEKKFIHSSHDEHKLRQIDRILSTYPSLPFVLIGDSGQRDPEIYEAVVEKYPGRIRAIYIRDVTLDHRDVIVTAVASKLQTRGVPMVFGEKTDSMAEHAATLGLVRPAAVEKVDQQKKIDHAIK